MTNSRENVYSKQIAKSTPPRFHLEPTDCICLQRFTPENTRYIPADPGAHVSKIHANKGGRLEARADSSPKIQSPRAGNPESSPLERRNPSGPLRRMKIPLEEIKLGGPHCTPILGGARTMARGSLSTANNPRARTQAHPPISTATPGAGQKSSPTIDIGIGRRVSPQGLIRGANR